MQTRKYIPLIEFNSAELQNDYKNKNNSPNILTHCSLFHRTHLRSHYRDHTSTLHECTVHYRKQTDWTGMSCKSRGSRSQGGMVHHVCLWLRILVAPWEKDQKDEVHETVPNLSGQSCISSSALGQLRTPSQTWYNGIHGKRICTVELQVNVAGGQVLSATRKTSKK